MARSVLDSFIELARDKIPRGAKMTMRNNNVVQSQVAQAEAQLSAWPGCVIGVLEDVAGTLVEKNGAACRSTRNATLRLATTWAIHQRCRDAVDVLLYQAAGAVTAIFNVNLFWRKPPR